MHELHSTCSTTTGLSFSFLAVGDLNAQFFTVSRPLMKFPTGFLVFTFNFFDSFGHVRAQHFANAAGFLHIRTNVGGVVKGGSSKEGG